MKETKKINMIKGGFEIEIEYENKIKNEEAQLIVETIMEAAYVRDKFSKGMLVLNENIIMNINKMYEGLIRIDRMEMEAI